MKILVADDEVLVRIGLKSVLEGCGLGFEVVEAEDGAEALEKYREIRPPLVFADINMPKMDGLKFIEAAKKENGNSRFIILTCYTDFNYMREAIKIGIHDYIVKTSIKNDELLRIAAETEQELAGRGETPGLPGEDRNIRELVAHNELKKAIGNVGYDSSLLKEFMRKRCVSDRFDIMVASEKKLTYRVSSRLKTVGYGIVSMADELLKEYGSGFIFEYERGKYVIIASLQGFKEEFCARLTLSMKNYFNIEFCIGVFPDSGLAAIAEGLQKAEDALEYSFYHKGPGFYFYREGQYADDLADDELDRLRRQIADSLKIMEYHKILASLDSYIENMDHMRSCRVEKAVNAFFNIFYMINQHIETCHPDRKKDLYDCDTYYTSLLECSDIYQIVDIISSMISKLINMSPDTGTHYYEGIAQKATDYIDRNIEKDISLQIVSQHVGLSPSHFSKVFKDITGLNFIDYCIAKRVEKAKGYINEGTKVFIAAEKVGYNNYSYFSRLFKKITGVTPEEYKKR